ncbi:MAG: NAD(P)-dependent oxidoreductase [Deltaproteobacteria bacterium]|nr:NAD(P)-dependent oxidoreductase [Deltaproteobacteria bacterium]
MIAFYGAGMLGTGFVRALRKKGEAVRVWNRTHAKAAALEDSGAQAFADPAEAAKGATHLHLSLSDDDAVDDVLERARPSFAQGVVIIDHTTTSATGTKARAARWEERGVTFVHAPVFMGPQNALESTGLMLVSGARARVEAVKPRLAGMTGKVVDLGDRVDAAASFKLLGNLFLMFLTSGLADLLSLAKALGVPPLEAATLFSHFNPGMTIDARMKRMTDAKFSSPSWELSMARKDARLMMEEAARAGVDLAVLPAIASRMDAVIAQGHGKDDWTVIAKDALDV